jgi:hypothetical protein
MRDFKASNEKIKNIKNRFKEETINGNEELILLYAQTEL